MTPMSRRLSRVTSRVCGRDVTRESRYPYPALPSPAQLKDLGYYCMHRYVATARDTNACMRGATR